MANTATIRAALRVTLAMASVGSTTACRPPPSAMPESVGPITTELGLHPVPHANAGRPFRVVVRSVSQEQFAASTYAEVARLVTDPDETVLEGVLVFPGQAQHLSLEHRGPIAVYALFTDTKDNDRWKFLIDDEEHVELVLGPNTVTDRPM